jgi:hypothetical protein
MKEWKWSNGDVYEKSQRIIQAKHSDKEEIIKTQDYYNNIIVDNRIGAVQQSLEVFDSVSSSSSMENDEPPAFLYNDFNKRESSYNKIADRDMFMQVGGNPFLQNNNYVNDILTQDRFLKPISTTMDKEHEKNNQNEKESASTQYSANIDY